MMHKLYRIALALLVCAAFTSAAFAQNANSSIQGTVEDTHGAVVPGAAVELTNVGTSQQRSTTSNANGFFVFTNLGPADYKVTVTSQGFATWEGTLTLRVSQAAQVSPTLTAAAVSTHVTVRNVTPVVDRVNATISDVKNATTIEAMPITGRTVLQVLAFSPGVVANNFGHSGNGFTRVNGVPGGGSVNYLLDGQTATNAFSGELQQNPQSTMTLQEVKIQTSNGDAQFGSPGVVEMVTKSGTNRFHGQIFELNQNQHLKARSYHSGPVIPFLQHNEYGFQVGGPIVPNHTFFFFDMEWLKTNENSIERYIVPTQAQRQGDLSDLLDGNGNPITIYDPNSTTLDPVTGAYVRTPFPNNTIPTDRLNPVASKIMGVTPVAGLDPYPLPNIQGQKYWEGDPNLQPANTKAPTNAKQITAKVDQLFGASRLAGRYNYSELNELNPESYAPTNPDVDEVGGHNGSLSLTTVFSPNTVNVAHFGVQYYHHFSGPQPMPGIPDKLGLPAYPNSNAWVGFYWNYGNDGYWTALDRDNPKDYPNQIVSLSDQFSWNHGNHQMMFGFEINNSRITTSEVGQPGGNYVFGGNFTALQDPAQVADGSYDVPLNDTGSAFADFLLGDVSGDYLYTYPVYHTRQTEYAGFAQDNWRVTQKLTLNLGLRYQYWTPFADADNLVSTFNPSVSGGMIIYAGKGPLPSQTPQAVFDSFIAAGLPIESADQAGYPLSLFTMPKNNWEPRLGFAYQLDNKTVLRGGWGIYQWILPLQQFQQAMRKNPPFSYSANIQPGTVDGATTNTTAAILEFPIASANYGGPQPINQFMMGSQNCDNQPAGTCNPPGLLLDISNVHITQGAGFPFVAMDPNVKPSTVQEYNLTLGRELPWHTGLQISYIGNHYTNMLQFDPINYLVPRDNCAAANSPDVSACEGGNAKFRRPYEAFHTSAVNNYNYLNYNGYGNTNELQVQLTHTFGGGLIAQGYFTWLKSLSTLSGAKAFGQGQLQISQNSSIPAALTPGYSLTDPTSSGWSLAQRTAALYSNDANLPAKTVQFNINYTLPFGKGQRFLGNAHGLLNALVSGYNIAPYFLWHSGFYFAPYATPLATGGRGTFLAPGKTGILPESERTPQRWFDASIWDPLATSGPTSGPYNGQTYVMGTKVQQGDFRNNIPFNYMTGPGFNEMDVGLYKVTPLWKSLSLDFAAQIYNVYNHINLGMPNTKGVINGGQGTPRNIQLQAKIVF